MVQIRQLQEKDALLMLEWMHDDFVVHDLATNFVSKTIEDCRRFIKISRTDEHNRHFAIVDEQDTYLGTVSLKNIDQNNSCAEFAITIRRCAMGTGASRFAMDEIIKYGFKQLRLQVIYWYVDRANQRAVRFYEKMGYLRTNIGNLQTMMEPQKLDGLQGKNYIWYMICNNLEMP